MPLEPATVLKALTVWEKTYGNGRTTVDKDLVMVWTGVLNTRGVTEEELREASVEVMASSRFMPKPAEVLELIARLRVERRRALAPRLVMARDAFGNELPRPVPIDRVDEHGRLITPGSPALPPPPKALPATEAPLTLGAIRDQLRGMSPIARRAFIGLIRLEGGDASEEIAAVRAIEAEERAEEEAEIDRRDAERAKRVRDQAAAMRRAAFNEPTPE